MEEIGGEWSSKMEDMIDNGKIEEAIQFMQNIISKLESLPGSDINLTLSSALKDIANLYSIQGLSIKADDFLTKSLLIKNRSHQSSNSYRAEKIHLVAKEDTKIAPPELASNEDDDDWETVADKSLDLPICKSVRSELSNLSISTDSKSLKQRGRGNFTYGRKALYSDEDNQSGHEEVVDNHADEDVVDHPIQSLKYGISHVLVIDGFSPNTLTIDLEKLFQKYSNGGVVIRRINDTVALVVFAKPASAREALKFSYNGYNIRKLEENDDILVTLSDRDLEPPVPRPRTSAQTAQRMIVGALRSQGLKSNVEFKSTFKEIEKQEDERKSRLVMRQKLREEAWGSDD